MSHRYKKAPPSAKVYRHFAAITLVVTGLLAIFTEGESAEAVTLQVQEQRREQVAAEQEKHQPRAEIQQSGGVWGSDVPVQAAASLVPTGAIQSYASSLGGGWFKGVHSSDYLSQLSPEERDALELAIAENTGNSTDLQRSQAVALEAASRRRSGSVGRE